MMQAMAEAMAVAVNTDPASILRQKAPRVYSKDVSHRHEAGNTRYQFRSYISLMFLEFEKIFPFVVPLKNEIDSI